MLHLPAAPHPPDALYTTGSTMRHVLVLAGTGSVGLIAIFAVDFANLFYIALLGDPALTAAVGYAATILYFHIAVCIGLMIAATALCARAIGAGDRVHAREVAASSASWMVVVIGAASLVTLPFVDPLLSAIGAEGATKAVAARFMVIVLPSTALMGLGMAFTGLLRAAGDPKRAMITTLVYAGATAALDPIFIFLFGLGLTGAAISVVLARACMVAYSLDVLVRRHDMMARPTVKAALRDFRPLAQIGIPAVLTNIATPVGNGYVTAAIAAYGDQAVAGWTIIARLVPVAFGGIFALSGAVGPVLGQNFGARAFDRVRRAMTDCLAVSTAYVVVVCVLLFLGRGAIVAAFGVAGPAAELIDAYCRYMAVTFIFAGALFVANAAFNNLGHAALSTLLNWGRATFGTVPFVLAGAALGGADGALAGYFLGAVPFGLLAIFLSYRVIGRLELDGERKKGWRAVAALIARHRPAAGSAPSGA